MNGSNDRRSKNMVRKFKNPMRFLGLEKPQQGTRQQKEHESSKIDLGVSSFGARD